MVPPWLQGTWERSYIRRLNTDTGLLGEPDSSVEVTYLQTPWAFIDIRRPRVAIEGGKEVAMAFAGITIVHTNNGDNDDDEKTNNDSVSYKSFSSSSSSSSSSSLPLVHWHTCLEMGSSELNCQERWTKADDGNPHPTEDQGYFENIMLSHEESKDYYLERDPGGTLEELWMRTKNKNENENNHEKSEYLAARRGYHELFIVVATSFGYANQEKNIFVSGIVSSSNNDDDDNDHHHHRKQQQQLEIKLSASDMKLEGTSLLLEKEGWTILPGSTMSLDLLY